MLGGGQQHGGVAVVAAGVHLALVLAGVGEGVVLGHRQRVDVGAQAHRAAAGAVLDDADHAGLAQAAVDGDAPVGQRLGDDVGGAVLLKAQLGVGVDVTADGGDGGHVGQDGFDEVHGFDRSTSDGLVTPLGREKPSYPPAATPCQSGLRGCEALCPAPARDLSARRPAALTGQCQCGQAQQGQGQAVWLGHVARAHRHRKQGRTLADVGLETAG